MNFQQQEQGNFVLGIR